MTNVIKMPRVYIVLILALMVVSLLAGCSSSDSENAIISAKGTSAEPSAEQETTVPTEQESPTTEATVPDETIPDETVPEETVPEETVPEATEDTSTDVETPSDETLVTYYATKKVNYRTGPGTNYKKVGSLSKGTAVKVVKGSKTKGWYKVKIDGEDNYVYAAYLSKTKPSAGNSSSTGSTGNTSSKPESNKPSNATSSTGVANTKTGISWDGKSPIIYTYADGSTGTKPVEGATYESKPGVITTYKEYNFTVNKTEHDDSSANSKSYCDYCGKVDGDGTKGTCLRWMGGGEHTCSHCHATVPGNVCHTCAEN